MENIGYATISITPSLRGLQTSLQTQLTPVMATEGARTGSLLGSAIGADASAALGRSSIIPTVPLATEAEAGGSLIGSTLAGAAGVALGLAIPSILGIFSTLVDGARSLITTGLTTAASNQSALKSLQTLTGSAEQAQQTFSDLQKFAANTPFDFTGALQGAQRLLGANVAGKDLIPTLTALGDATSAVGGSTDDFNRTLLAYSQLMTRGKLDTGDLLQISNNGIPIWKELAKALGQPENAIQDLVSTGSLLSDDTLPKLLAQLEKDYGGSMAQQAQTLSGAWSNLSDTVSQSLGQAFAPLADWIAGELPTITSGLGTILGDLNPVLSAVVTWLQQNGPTIISTLGQVYDWTKRVFQGMADAWNSPAAAAVRSAIGAFNDALGDLLDTLGKHPRMAELAGVALVGFGVGLALPSFYVGALVLQLDQLLHALEAAANSPFGQTLLRVLSDAFNGAKRLIDSAVDFFSDLGPRLVQGFLHGFDPERIVSAIVAPFSGGLASVRALLGINSPSRVMRDIAGYVVDGFTLGLAGRSDDITAAYGAFSAPAVSGAQASRANSAISRQQSAPAYAPVQLSGPADVLALISDVAEGRVAIALAAAARDYSNGTRF